MVGGLTLHLTTPPNPTQLPNQQPHCPPSLNHIRSIQDFKQAHANFIKLGLDQIPRHAGELLSVCALSGWDNLDYAQSIFYGLDNPGSFDFNTMIRAQVNHSNPNQAILLYQEMVENDIKPDNFTYPFAIKACTQLSAIREGTQVHGQAAKLGFSDDVFVQSGLINLYGKCEDIDSAGRVFAQMGCNKTAASLSAMLAVHRRMGLWSECLNIFTTMVGRDLRLDESSLVSALSSCAHLGMLDVGKSVHCSLVRNFTGLNVIVQTSLIDMYFKCGLLEKGLTVFDRMSSKNEWAYSAVISGLAMHGEGEKALEIFADMIKDGVEPDEVIYVGVLSACSHAGLVEEGLRLFDRMRFEHRIVPNAQHYGCIVDLVGRAGKLDEASALVGSMPVGLTTNVAWRSLLSACRVHGNLELAERALRILVELGCAKAGDYVILSNMYAKIGRWGDAARTRTEMVDRGLTQDPGFSRVEVKGRMHTFVSMDKSHQQSNEVYEMLYQTEWQLRFEGYEPDTSQVMLRDVDDEEKVEVLNGHSQKLAIAFGLLNTKQGDSVRVFTNLRMSNDCHTYSGLISKIFEREIVVRDRIRFHHFRQGVCSCKNYW